MARIAYTQTEVEILRENPYTLSVSQKQIRFSIEFKERFMELLITGKSLRGIFLELGYDPDMFGYERMCNISSRIQKEAQSPKGLHEGNIKHFSRPLQTDYSKYSADEAMARMQHEILYLKQEMEFIKKILKAGKPN